MSRRSFSEDDFSESTTLQNVSANLQTIKRMMGWGTTEMAKQVGISDRHLDSLLRMTSNVTVLVLEKIAEGLGVPVLRLAGTRIVVRGHVSGDDFLAELQKEPWHISSEDYDRPVARVLRKAASRNPRKAAPAAEEPEMPAGMESFIKRLVDVQERLGENQNRTSSKVDKLAEQVQNLASAVRGQTATAGSAAAETAKSGRGAKGSRKSGAAADAASDQTGKRTRGRTARSSASTPASKSVDGGKNRDTDGDLFNRSAPEPAKRRSSPRAAPENVSQPTRGAALKSHEQESAKTAKPKNPMAGKRPYTRKR